MKNFLLFTCAILISAGVLAQNKPAPKATASRPATPTVQTPAAPETPPAPEPEAPAPELDENGWPITNAAPAPEATDKKPAGKKATAKGKAAAPAKPVVYQPAMFAYALDAKPLDAVKGIPAKAKGVLSVNVKNFQKVARENPKVPIKMQLSLVDRATKSQSAPKEVALAFAKKGIPLDSYFGTKLKPGDQIHITLTNTKEPQTAIIEVEIPESAILTASVDGKKLSSKTGLTPGTGVITFAAKGIDKLKKADEANPLSYQISHLRKGQLVHNVDASPEEAQAGLLLNGILKEAQSGDVLKVEILNSVEPHIVTIPVN